MVINIKTAAAYIRVSTEEQTELSPASQLVEIRKWAAQHGYIVPDEYVFSDEGISGRKVTGRDSFRHMIGVAKTKPKPFDAILLWKFSRFARNRDDAVFYKSILRKQLGIEVLSISEPMADGKMGIITEALIEAMDEYYSINLAEEVKRGMTEKHRRGELQSSPSFGYHAEGGVLVPYEAEAVLVREIFRRFVGGEGFFPLAKWLNAIGARTHRGNPFENRTVEYLLRNPVYIGKLRWNPAGRTRRDWKDPNVILVDGHHAPLVDTDLWNAAQARIAEVKAVWKYHGRPVSCCKDWISGLIRCSSCGATMIFSAPHFWKCNNYVKGRCLTSQHVDAELLKTALIHRLQEDMSFSDLPLIFRVIRSKDGGDDQLSALQTSRASLERTMLRLREAYLAGVDTVEEYKEAKASAQRRLQELDEQISSCEAETKKLTSPASMRVAISAALQIIVSDTSTLEEKYNAAHSIIDYATWDKAQSLLQVHYRLIF